MKTALDSSVILAILNGESGAEAWMDAMVGARRQGQLLLCEVVLAEISPAFSGREELLAGLADLGAYFDPIGLEAAWLAGSTFKAYRQAGGPREHMIPDFLVAAHAQIQASRLAAIDRGYLRRYFPKLELLAP